MVPEKKYAVLPAATESVDMEGFNSQLPIGPSRVYDAICSRARRSNQRICLSSQAVVRTFVLLPQIKDLIVLLWTPGAISYPFAGEILPFLVLLKVGLVGDEESLWGELVD